MKLVALRKIHEGKFLTYYVADYLKDNGKIKSYEFISRDKNLTLSTFGHNKPAGVGLGHRMGILGCSTAEMKMSLGC